MSVVLVGRSRPDTYRMNSLQISLVASTLIAVDAADRDLFAPHGYVPSHVCTAWSTAVLAGLPDLVLVEVWDAPRATVRPWAVVRTPVALQRGRRTTADPWAALPALAERTPVAATPFSGTLVGLATWLGTCGGCTLEPGQR